MFSNADFANMIRGGGGGGGGKGGGGGDKARFDLKQIKQWDNQNKQEYENKKARSGGGGGGVGGGKKRSDNAIPTEKVTVKSALIASGYRDRALERRKEENKEFHDQQLAKRSAKEDSIHQPPSSMLDIAQTEDDIIAQLDAEQTKFLGGDVEHTHLVKGLDYALLAKTREQLMQESEENDGDKKKMKVTLTKGTGSSKATKKKVMNIFDDDDDDDDDDEGEQDKAGDDNSSDESENEGQKVIRTCTTLGASLKRMMFTENNTYNFRNFTIDMELNQEEFLLAQQQHYERDKASDLSDNQAHNKLVQLHQSYGSAAAGSKAPVVTPSVQSGLDARNRLLVNHTSRAGDTLARTTYSFDILKESEVDIPLTVVRSKKGGDTREDYVCYMLRKDLLQKIQELFIDGEGKLLPKSKRKPRPEAPTSAPALPPGVPGRVVATTAPSVVTTVTSAPIPAPITSKKISDSIYDDDDLDETPVPTTTAPSQQVQEDVKPEPVKIKPAKRSIEGLNTIVIFSDDEDELDFIAREKYEKEQKQRNEAATGELKGLFRNLKSTVVQINKPETAVEIPAKTTVDVLQPVREMLIAKAAKERAQKQQQSSSAAVKEVKVDTVDTQWRGLIHRDVFASTIEKVVTADENLGKKRGDVFGVKGSYDLYPETGEYDILSDDEDGDKAMRQQSLARKRTRLEDDDTGGGGSGGRGFSGMGGKTPGFRKK